MNTNRGFTLVELLIVIAILAVLAVTVVVVLNPAELLRQARDSSRLSDMGTISRALSLYLADGQTWSSSSANPNCTAAGTSPTTGTCQTNASTIVTGAGWVSVNFSLLSTGAPLSSLPLDPVNDTTNFYVFERTDSLTYEIDANLESTKYLSKEGSDGGNNANWYEVGSDPALDL